MADFQELKRDIYDFNDPEKQCRAAHEMRFVRNNSQVVYILFQCCYEAGNPKLQKEAVKSLGVLVPEKALQSFLKMTHNADPEKQCRAYYFLGHLGNPQATEEVTKGLRHSDMRVRRAAVISLGRLGRGYREINALNALLDSREPEQIQTEARRSIQFIKGRMPQDRRTSETPPRSFNKPEYSDKRGRFTERKIPPRKTDLPRAF